MLRKLMQFLRATCGGCNGSGTVYIDGQNRSCPRCGGSGSV
ncbi:hypothetical protein ACFV0L_18435 [Streptosporangium canum]